ncbi:uncharacterized protein LOC8275155 [Ricinus communis]|uniref:uncharacterized protein LOC8275155 n=1 Tax=Ricinus communis TaxID=3988 RepID=UPI0007723C18|nr:uncharacterized protein LOC8275155 [Ricinus communis]|eukprot:XP_015576662.1 uncharacterized protein LOC8275155 [Ricinus communis]
MILMDKKCDEKKTNVGSFCQVNQGTNRNTTGETSNSDHRVVSENSVVLNPEDSVSAGGEIRALDANVNGLGSTMTAVDHEASGGMGIREPLDQGTSGNSSYLVNEVVLERMIVINSGEIVSISGEHKHIGINIDDLGLTGIVSDQKTWVTRGNAETVDKVGQVSHQDPSISSNDVVVETVILVNSEENPSISGGNDHLEIKGRELGPGKVMVDKSKKKVPRGEKQSCVIDVKCGEVGSGFKDCDGESVCRICHLSSEVMQETTATNSSMELIQLGCGCKDELGIAHAYCAEAWFKLKGNRICEICGETAKNVTGVRDNRFMEEWNERRIISTNSSSPEGGGGCWRGQPFCNFLMACLVIAFVLPWFFRVNMF